MIELEFNKDLLWESDWNGDEVGFPDVNVVGLYRLKDTQVYFYVDIEDMKILEAWEIKEEDF